MPLTNYIAVPERAGGGARKAGKGLGEMRAGPVALTVYKPQERVCEKETL